MTPVMGQARKPGLHSIHVERKVIDNASQNIELPAARWARRVSLWQSRAHRLAFGVEIDSTAARYESKGK
jgi:hypothetical protein